LLHVPDSEKLCGIALSTPVFRVVHFLPCCFYKIGYTAPVEEGGEEDKMADRLDLPQGTLDLLILKALATGALHGWGISDRLQQISRDALQLQQGSLYPALHRLERRGWVKARWAITENSRRAKYYELTRPGQRQLEKEIDAWRRLTDAMACVLDTA
jgi:PadR family transcriptional regulator PadR